MNSRVFSSSRSFDGSCKGSNIQSVAAVRQDHQKHGCVLQVPVSVVVQQCGLLACWSRGRAARRRPQLGVAAARAGTRPTRYDTDVVLRFTRRTDPVRATVRSFVRRADSLVTSALLSVSRLTVCRHV